MREQEQLKLTVIRNINAGRRHVIDGGVIEGVGFRVTDVRRQCVLLSTAVFPHDHPACHHVLTIPVVFDGVRRVCRVGCVPCEVDALAVGGRVLSAKGSVEALLHDFIDNCVNGASPKAL
jgi:hypothetical protein